MSRVRAKIKIEIAVDFYNYSHLSLFINHVKQGLNLTTGMLEGKSNTNKIKITPIDWEEITLKEFQNE